MDVTTLAGIACLTSFSGCVCFLILARMRLPLRGPGYWACATACGATGYLFVALRPLSPWLLNIIVANILFISCLMLHWTGIRRFLGWSPSPLLRLLLVSCVAYPICYAISPLGSQQFRIIFFSLTIAAVLLLMARDLLSAARPSRRHSLAARRMLALALSLNATMLIVRAALTYVLGVTLPTFISGTLTLATFSASIVFSTFFIFGLMLFVLAECVPVPAKEPLPESPPEGIGQDGEQGEEILPAGSSGLPGAPGGQNA
ncbi:hypothetical protein dsx2_1571 [Desulfovibrio sp. X2]|uniref:hypothetical protein n=1 Tax=Desulfovibrio sp. X2 TaxID=941449 RepID=UPI000358AD7E|nr:hypothetical protein [Desulfovibrio sp. X2]EPR44462.1 hypothetical protein dsx2_1571 [Desulfovibrio sp. X2]